MAAQIAGKVIYNQAEDCFQLETETATYPLVWPHGTTGSAEPPGGVILDDGTAVHDGQSIWGSGGYIKVADEYGIPTACRSPNGDVAVLQTT